MGFAKGLAVFKVLAEQSLAIKLATPEIYNCRMLYAPFRANRYDGCGEKRPLRRSLVTTKGARSTATTTTTKRKREVENWKPGDKVVTAKSGKLFNLNSIERVSSSYSNLHLHSPWLLANSHHSRRSIHGHFRWQTTIGAHQRDALVALDLWAFRIRCSFKGQRPSCPFDLHIRRITTTTATTTSSKVITTTASTTTTSLWPFGSPAKQTVFLLHFCRASEVHHHRHQLWRSSTSIWVAILAAAAASPLARFGLVRSLAASHSLSVRFRFRFASASVRALSEPIKSTLLTQNDA